MKKVIKNHSAMTLGKFIEKHLFRPQSDSIECKYFIKCRQSEQFSCFIVLRSMDYKIYF